MSTEEQATGGVSLAAQEERIKAYCALQGLKLTAVDSEEGVTDGRHLADRPGGQELISNLMVEGIKHVVALKLDRLFRDAGDALRETKEWDRTGAALHLVDMGGQTVNTATAMGRFFLNVMAGFAELERDLIAERTAAALQHKKDTGEVYGPTPYGFDRNGDRLMVNYHEWETVERVHKWRQSGWSLRRIAEELNSRDVPGKRGGKWYASTVRYLLDNPIYTGDAVAGVA